MESVLHLIHSHFGHQLVMALLDHGHWWLHLVVHTVLIFAPITLAILALAWAIRSIGRNLRASRSRHANAPAQILVPPGLEASVFSYILRYTARNQALLVAGAAISLPLLYATLELPKMIINGALTDGVFPYVVRDVALDRVTFLFVLCGLYLAAMVVNGGIKYAINVHKGRVGERLLRRLRLAIWRGWMRGPKRSDATPLIPILVQEVEPVGGFAGDAFVTPAFKGGTFLTILAFMLVQDPVLGAAAVTLLPIQLALIPRLQKRINSLAIARVREVRQYGSHVSNAAIAPPSAEQVVKVAGSLRRIQEIRFELYCRKFMLKFINNFLMNLTPFFFYTIGGYLVIEGKLTLGALVAVIAAYKDFAAPLRELFKYYQTMEDVRVRYREILLSLSAGDSFAANHPLTTKSGCKDTASLALAALTSTDK